MRGLAQHWFGGAQFSFWVGQHERHEVVVHHRGVNARVTIHVDGVLALDSGGAMSFLMPNVFDLEVGVQERHMVSVRFIFQAPIDGGAKYIDVFVDGRYSFRHPW